MSKILKLKKNKKIKIGCITSSISYTGGWDTLSKGIISAVDKECNVVVLTASDANNDEVAYPVHKILPKHIVSFGVLNQVKIFFSCIRYFRNCDVIHVFIEPFGPGAAFASLVLRKPFMITTAGTYSVIPEAKNIRTYIKRVMMIFMYRQASLVATGSMRNIELIEENVSLHDRWKFIPFGVDLDKFTPITKPVQREKIILTVGALKPRKGVLYTLKALNQIATDLPDYKYCIAGSYSKDSKYYREILEFLDTSNIKERVELLGRVSDEKLLELYKQCRVFVLAAQTVNGSFEGFPMVFYEAQSQGAPVVSTKGFGSEYVIKDGFNGFLVEQGEINGLAEKIKEICINDVLNNSMSLNAVEEAKRHSWDEVVKLYIEEYKKAVKRKYV